MSRSKKQRLLRLQEQEQIFSACRIFQQEYGEGVQQAAVALVTEQARARYETASLRMNAEQIRSELIGDSHNNVVLELRATLRCPLFSHKVSACLRVGELPDADPADLARLAHDRCEEGFAELVQSLVSAMPRTGEAWDSASGIRLTRVGRDRMALGDQFLRELPTRAWCREMVRAGNEMLERRRGEAALGTPVTVSGVSADFTGEGNRLGLTLKVRLRCGEKIVGEEDTGKGPALFAACMEMEPQAFRTWLADRCRELALEVLGRVLAPVPDFLVPPGPEAQTVGGVLKTGEIPLGDLPECGFSCRLLDPLPRKNRGGIDLLGAGEEGWTLIHTPFARENRSVTVVPGSEDTPGTLLWQIRCLREAAGRYETLGLSRHPLALDLRGGEVQGWTWNGISLKPSPELRQRSRQDLRGALEDILAWCRQEEEKLNLEPQTRLQILGTLNPGQLHLLKYMLRNGGTWASDAGLTTDGCCTRVALVSYLDDLAALEIPVRGARGRVVCTQWVKATYGSFRKYTCNGVLTREMLEAVTPRPYSPGELDDLSPEAREQWLVDRAAAGEEGPLLEALNTLPRATAARFLKSAEGRAFLSTLGEEALSPFRPLLDSLPGCRRLLSQLNAEAPTFLQRKERPAKPTATRYLEAFSLDHLLETGRKLPRSFVLHVGGTNSGKTYQSLQILRQAKTGVYLGPLRLLALEVFDTLNEDGFPCSLLTGEEKEEVQGAGLTASTIEMADYRTWYDVAVIDEAQMLRDPERGCVWLQAICTIGATQVHICTAPEGLDILRTLLERMSAPYEIREHSRLAPLVWGGTMKDLTGVEPGDALITFSRKSVLGVAAELERMDIPASVIYGALPPQSRREEVRRFREGETRVVVATDAIGMGVSLPIRRIIFCQTTKFDGETTRGLRNHEIQQIAGRAGRFGIYDEGYVLSMSDSGRIRKALEARPTDISRVMLPFPREALDTGYPLRTLLKAWNELPGGELFARADVTNERSLLNILCRNLPARLIPDKRTVYAWISCPVDYDNGPLVSYWVDCCAALAQGQPIPTPRFSENTLEQCELKYRALDVQHQMGRRGGVEIDNREDKKRISDRINALLKESKDGFLRRCSRCGKILPPNTTYGMCQECYDSMRRRWDYDEDWY